ncbi:hypothetical protein BR93DRAFT_941025 [Coniochaeta sp. PMI_546]|nr:hypothetical protein BR93DRAFT_941025 [Coniochaeta sp. PMI_546]
MFSVLSQTLQSTGPSKQIRANGHGSASEHKAVPFPRLLVEDGNRKGATKISMVSRKALTKGRNTNHKITKNTKNTRQNRNSAGIKRLKATQYVVRGKNATIAGQRIDVEKWGKGIKLRIYTDKKMQERASAMRLGALMRGLSLAEKAQRHVDEESIAKHLEKMEIDKD